MAKVVKTPIVSYVVDVKCDCGGDMEWDYIVLTSNPPRYEHECKTCGKIERLTERTGNLVHERAESRGSSGKD